MVCPRADGVVDRLPVGTSVGHDCLLALEERDTARRFRRLPLKARWIEGAVERTNPTFVVRTVADRRYDQHLTRARGGNVCEPNALRFINPGVALESDRQVADYIVAFEVTPRNLNLTR